MAEYFLERLRSQGAWFDAMVSLGAAGSQSVPSRRQVEQGNIQALDNRTACSHTSIGIDSIGDAYCEHCGEDLT
jgi:hypothetical protein